LPIVLFFQEYVLSILSEKSLLSHQKNTNINIMGFQKIAVPAAFSLICNPADNCRYYLFFNILLSVSFTALKTGFE